MGGVLILLVYFQEYFYGEIYQIYIFGFYFILLLFGLLGAYDDYKKIKYKNSSWHFI